MKKVIFVLGLIMSILSTAQAGYVIQGINTSVDTDDLKNYTLTFRPDGVPVSAASMHTTLVPSTGKNTIVIIQSDDPLTAYRFPIALSSPNDIEVRDFHYDQSKDAYVLCGSRGPGHAFVAVVDGFFSSMLFMEYPAAIASVFYSIADPNTTTTSALMNDYHLCGARGGEVGVIASVDRTTLQLTHNYYTDIKWEYHKIIAKPIGAGAPTPLTPIFVASGRDPGYSRIGFTTLNLSFAPINSYIWGQVTDPQSHCVVSDDVSVNNAVILASSNESIVTLNSVTYSPSTMVRAYRFVFPVLTKCFVQDIGAIKLTANTFRISVAGFKRGPNNAQIKAWHGHLVGLSATIPMTNNDYYQLYFGAYEHYKIRYQYGGFIYKEYTGGYYQRDGEMGALFATPLTVPNECGDTYDTHSTGESITWSSFSVSSGGTPFTPDNFPIWGTFSMDFENLCGEFKGGDPAPKSVMSAENESEITTSYDRITLKDIPANTGYQIYNTIGQLISTGVTTPDISTASLSKGVYILRLESGKTFKFVK